MKVIYLPFPSSYYKRILSTNRSIIILYITKKSVNVDHNFITILLIVDLTHMYRISMIAQVVSLQYSFGYRYRIGKLAFEVVIGFSRIMSRLDK